MSGIEHAQAERGCDSQRRVSVGIVIVSRPSPQDSKILVVAKAKLDHDSTGIDVISQVVPENDPPILETVIGKRYDDVILLELSQSRRCVSAIKEIHCANIGFGQDLRTQSIGRAALGVND